MYCSNCGEEFVNGNKYCLKCGYSVSSKETTIVCNAPFKYPEPGSGSLILILGIFSFIFGPLAGIPAWVMGQRDLKKIKNGIIPTYEKKATKIGMIFGILNTLIVFIIVVIAIVLAIYVYYDMLRVQTKGW